MTLRERFRAAFVTVVIGLLVVGGLSAHAVHERSQALLAARRISATQAGTQQVFAALMDQQTRLQTYLDTGTPDAASDLAAAEDRTRLALTDLTPLVDGRPAEAADLGQLQTAVSAWQVSASQQVANVPAAGAPVPPRADRSADDQAFEVVTRALLMLQSDSTAAMTAARARLDAAVARVTRALYAGLICAALLLGAYALLVRRWVLLPLAALTAPVRDVGAGALGTVIPSAGPPELARLGADVDTMRRRMLAEADTARQANVDLSRAEAEQRLMFDSIRDYAIVRLDRDGVVTSWNTGAEALSGRTAAEMVGRTIELMQEDDDRPVPAVLAEVAARGAVQRQLWRRHADGDRMLVSQVVTAIKDPAGTVTGFAVVSRDVTAAAAAEGAILRARDELAERNADLERVNSALGRANEALEESNAALQRTNSALERSNTRLAETNAELLAANEELDAFSYTVSHDLRAPLRAINGFSELLLEEHGASLDGEARRLLGRVGDNAGRMGLLIDDLLAFAKLRRAGLAKSPTAVADTVREAWADLQPEARPGGAELTLAELPRVPADPRLLKQVFANLLGNAVKFSPADRRAVVEVTAGPDPDGSGQPVFSVRDQGSGFDPRYADRLFQVFQRLHDDSVEGTGIGLSIVHRIVTRHGGRIWAGAEPGAGATFSFTLGPDTAGIPTAAGDPAVPAPRSGPAQTRVLSPPSTAST